MSLAYYTSPTTNLPSPLPQTPQRNTWAPGQCLDVTNHSLPFFSLKHHREHIVPGYTIPNHQALLKRVGSAPPTPSAHRTPGRVGSLQKRKSSATEQDMGNTKRALFKIDE